MNLVVLLTRRGKLERATWIHLSFHNTWWAWVAVISRTPEVVNWGATNSESVPRVRNNRRPTSASFPLGRHLHSSPRRATAGVNRCSAGWSQIEVLLLWTIAEWPFNGDFRHIGVSSQFLNHIMGLFRSKLYQIKSLGLLLLLSDNHFLFSQQLMPPDVVLHYVDLVGLVVTFLTFYEVTFFF